MTRLGWMVVLDVAVALAAVACNSIWGIDQLGYGGGASPTGSGGTGATAGAGGTTAGGHGGQGGQGGSLPHPAVRWCKRFGDASDQHAAGLAVDAAGEIALTGGYSGQLDFGGTVSSPTAGASSVYVVKLDPHGDALWGSFPANDLPASATGVAIDGAGEVAAVGYFTQSLDFHDSDPHGPVTELNVYAAKFPAASSTPSWSASIGPDLGHQRGWGVALDGVGNVALLGSYDGSVDVGTTWTGGGDDDLFLATLAGTSGSPTWSQGFSDGSGSGNKEQLPSALVLDSAGAPIFVGHIKGSLGFNAFTLTAVNGQDAFVVKYGSQTADRWGIDFGDPQAAGCELDGGMCDQEATAVAVDASRDVAVTGWFTHTMAFGLTGDPLVSSGAKDGFVVKLDPNGQPLWRQQFGDGADQAGTGVAFDADGNVLLTGSFQGSVEFGDTVLTSLGADDVFLVKLDPAGNVLWAKRFGDTMGQSHSHVATGPDDSIVLFGEFAGSIDFLGSCSVTSAGGADLFLAVLDP